MAAIDYTLYVYIAPPALVAVVVSILSVWPYRRRRVATALIWYLVMVGAFLTTNVLELVSGSGVATIIWAKSSHMFFLGSGLAWLAFALSYSGYEALTAWRVYRWLALFPVVISVLIWSNELHGKFWAQVDLVRVGRFLAMQPQYGPWFWIHGVYLYTLLVAGVLLLIAVGARARGVIQRQTVVVSLGALIPVVFNLLYIFQVVPGWRKDYTPVALALSGLLFYVGVHRYGLMKVLPTDRHLVLEDIDSAVLVIDADGTVVDLNTRTETLFGVDHAQVLGVNASEHPLLGTVLSGVPLAQRMNFETTRERGHGEVQHLDVWVQPVHHPSGRHMGAIVTINDVTALNALLQERNRAISELQAERSRMLELQMQLRRQERLATIGQLAANMAHEISNPLTFVRSGFQEIERVLRRELTRDHSMHASGWGRPVSAEQQDQDELQQVVADVRHGLDRIAGVVHSLLDYSRGISRAAVSESVDFRSLIDNTLTLIGPALKGTEVHLDVPKDVRVRCRAGEISQVLLNLLLNAVQAIDELPRGERRRIDIVVTVEDRLLRCMVIDSGPGIDSDLRERIFDPFYTSKSDGQGTGLGLSISRGIVQDRHGGRLYAFPGRPTTFVMELPEIDVDER